MNSMEFEEKMEAADRCGLCLKSDSSVSAAGSGVHSMILDLFPLWWDDIGGIASCCFDCHRRLEDFHSFYEMVNKNREAIRNVQAPRLFAMKDIKVEEISVKVELENYIKEDHSDTAERRDETDGEEEEDEDDDDEPIGSRMIEDRHIPKNTVEHSNGVRFPQELIKDGKFIVGKKTLEKLASGFFSLQCKMCNIKFEKLRVMSKHHRSVHKCEPFVECCNKKISQRCFIYQHMAKHLQPSAFLCPICKKDFANTHVLKTHLDLHVPEEDVASRRIYKCDKCDKSYAFKSKLKQHIVSHIPEEEKIYRCEHCEQDFNDKGLLKEHVIANHIPENEKKLYTCEHCSKIFDKQSTRMRHEKAVHSKREFLCPECGKSFQRAWNLSEHLVVHNEGKGNIECSVCKRLFKTKSSLRHHAKMHGEFKYNCQHCPYITYNISLLKQHLLKHDTTGRRLFDCDVCGKGFKSKHGLQIHMPQHTGERKYCCPYCPKTFAQLGNLRTHRNRLHAEEHRNALQMGQNVRGYVT